MIDIEQVSQELFTLRDFLRFGVSQFNQNEVFFGHGTENAWDESLSLILNMLHLPMDIGAEVLDGRLTLAERQQLLTLFKRRIEENIPAPYLLKKAWFAGLAFYVDERVLIPRSPIFEIIQANFKPWYQGQYPDRILDLCTGSGCIGIACAYAFDEAEVVLADISADALDVAAINIKRHKLADRVSVLQSDLLQDVYGVFDIIVSNPPYVDAQDFFAMPREYQHEPAIALHSGELGLHHPLQILREASQYLAEDGLLVLEVGNSGMHLENFYPGIDFNWVEFQHGGFGVLVMSKAECEYYADQLALSPDYNDLDE
jgi:ribosomal protein L3 glutamine methyltransferase